MSKFLSRLGLGLTLTTLIFSLLLGESLAQNDCSLYRTVYLQADSELRTLSFPSSQSALYPNNCERTWIINARFGWVRLYILKLDIEDGCSFDSLTIYNIENGGRINLDTLCGEESGNRTFDTNAESIELKFSSDHGVQGTGFEIAYIRVPNEKFEPYFHLTATDDDQYLNFPLIGRYPNNAEVTWRITSSHPQGRVEIILLRLDIEEHSSCDYDSLTLYDSYNSRKEELAKLCGALSSVRHTFKSSSRELFLHFKSDNGIRGSGFKILYTNVKTEELRCSNSIASAEVIQLDASDVESNITSPHFPAKYPGDCISMGRITSHREHVRFHILALDLEENSDCNYDSLTFYDGYDDSASILKKLCGERKKYSNTFVSSSAYVFFRFATDRHRERSGFQITFYAEDAPESESSGYGRGVLGGAIIAGICFVLIIIGIVGFMVRRAKRQQRRMRSQHRNNSSLANSGMAHATAGSQSGSVFVVSPSAPPPPYSTLNHAYVHDEAPPSYCEANLYAFHPTAPPMYSNAMLSNVTEGQTTPATFPGPYVMAAAFKEEDDQNIYANEAALEANSQNQETTLSQGQDSEQEPQPDYGHPSSNP